MSSAAGGVKQLPPKDIDWGLCIPDCGRCCRGEGKEITPKEADEISSKLGQAWDTFCTLTPGPPGKREKIRLRTSRGTCIFQSPQMLCGIYGFRPSACRRYGSWLSDCRDFRRMAALGIEGKKIAAQLKALWLERIKSAGYSRDKWKVEAELIILDAARKAGIGI